MGKLRVFIYIIFFLIANKAISQSIDTVTISINFPFGYGEPQCVAHKISGGIDSLFTIDDLDDYSFKWRGDSVPKLDSLPTAAYKFTLDGTYNIGLTVVQKATSRIIKADTAIIIKTPVALVVPNVFTPNDDGVNDLFKVFYDGKTKLEISIFTRTGTEVFRLKSPTIIWDGRTSSGAQASEGIYYYVITSDAPGISTNGFLYLYNYDPNN
jgi:gliding motility-associated-like protein